MNTKTDKGSKYLPSIFISYSHADEKWKDRVVTQLRALESEGRFDVWEDRQIAVGDDWYPEIEQALNAASIAVLLISANFLTSRFIKGEEVPRLLKRRAEERLRIIPLIVKPCAWRRIGWLKSIQVHPRDGRPLSGGSEHEIDEELTNLVDKVDDLLKALPDVPNTLSPASLSSSEIDQPRYQNAHDREISQALETAYEQKETLLSAGQDITAVTKEILDLIRQMRQGPQLKAGDLLWEGRLKLLERLGSGGFATIWKSIDKKRHALVAIKVLHGQHVEDRSRRERFFRGARRMAALQHQGIVRVLEEKLVDEHYHFFVMEFLAGGDFQNAVLHNHIPVEERLNIILQVGEVLKSAHQRGIIHRDIKPANIVLDERGRPKLTDFDLVRAQDTTGLTRHGGAMGTFIYAPPELWSSPQDADFSADVYGLGMTAVFALYGAILPLDVMRDASGFIERLETHPVTKKVLQRAVEWDCRKRYESVAEFCEALTRSLWVEEAAETSVPAESKAKPDTSYKPYQGFRDRLTNNTEAPEMVYLPGGSFKMGNIQGYGLDREKPVHEVTLDAFAIGRNPLTVGDFRRFVEANGFKTEAEHQGGAYVYDGKDWGQKSDASWRNPYMTQDDDHPVVCISWNDATAYCEWLCEQTGEQYSLPTEAQWEYACRAASETAYCFGDDEQLLAKYAWYWNNSEGTTHPVGVKKANDWGLHDMHGNVWEWVQDWFKDYSKEPQINPSGPETGSRRVVRGGAWLDVAVLCRSACRGRGGPGYRVDYLGFRLARRV